MKATKVNAGLAESNGRLLPGIWRDSLHVTCGLTAYTPGSAPGPTLGNEYGKTLPLPLHKSTFGVHYRTGSPGQLGLRVAGFPDHWVTKCDPVPCLVCISLSQFGLQISSVSESCYYHIRQLRCIRPYTSTPKHYEVNLHRARLVLRCVTIHGYTDLVRNQPLPAIWNESVPIQLTQCWFPGLAISSANIYILRQSYDYLTIMPKLRSMTAHSGNLLLHHNYMLALEIASPGNQHCVNCIGTLSFHIAGSGWLRTKSVYP